jgi:hypothetical protein
LGEAYNATEMKTEKIFNVFTDFKSLELEVPTICLVTPCVSARRDRRYDVYLFILSDRDGLTLKGDSVTTGKHYATACGLRLGIGNAQRTTCGDHLTRSRD